MLYLIGTGLKPQHLTAEALKAIQSCSAVFLENYTSQFSQGNKKELEKMVGKKILELDRQRVEETFQPVFEKAKKQKIALLVIGNPLVATTHIQILLDADKQKIPVQVLPGISVADFLGKTGLDAYKFGRVCTVVFPEENYKPESFFDVIENNYRNGLHSLCLLDIRTEEKRLMTVAQAVIILERIEEKRSSNLLQKTILVGLYALGGKNEQIIAASAKELKNEIPVFPQALVVCGKLNEKEKECLAKLYGVKT